jgi:hypothetical protein
LMIDTARQASGGEALQQAGLLMEQLRRLPLDEVIEFQRILGSLQDESYNVDLWGAVLTIGETVSDEGFLGFRGWLVGQGQAVYEAAIANPDSLADLPELRACEYPWCDQMWYVASEVHEELTDGELPPYGSLPNKLIGSWWPYEEHHEQLRRRYPRLWARFHTQTHPKAGGASA